MISSTVGNLETPLHKAVQRGSYSWILPEIKKKPQDLNATTLDGETPLHYISKCKLTCETVEILNLLVENGANINASNKAGETLLHLLVKKNNDWFNNNILLIETAINKGADLNAQTLTGKTPFDYALENKVAVREVIILLYEKGAKISKSAWELIDQNLIDTKSAIENLNNAVFQELNRKNDSSQFNDKPILIVRGEIHRTSAHWEHQTIIGAAIRYGIKFFGIELDDSRFKNIQRYESWGEIQNFLQKFSLTLAPIDQGVGHNNKCKPYKNKTVPLNSRGEEVSPTDNEGMKYRNEIMAQELNGLGKDCLIIVGAAHAQDLKNLLSNDFEIIDDLKLSLGSKCDLKLASLTEGFNIENYLFELCQSKMKEDLNTPYHQGNQSAFADLGLDPALYQPEEDNKYFKCILNQSRTSRPEKKTRSLEGSMPTQAKKRKTNTLL